MTKGILQASRERIGVESIGYLYINPYLTPYTKISSRLHMKGEITIELLEESTGEIFAIL